MAVTAAVRTNGVRFHYPTHAVFDGLSLSAPNGITWLRGPNGRGKTTLLKLLGGALTPQRGTILLDGLDSVRDALAYRRLAYLCGGDTPALPWLAVRDLLDLHLALYASALAPEVAYQLRAFSVDDTLDQPLATLSLGQHRKVQLSLALSLPVRLLLLDEPFNGLDAPAVGYLQEQLAGRARDCYVVIASHVEPQLALAGTLDL